MALDHYLCQHIIPHDIKAEKISDTVDFHHQNITTPVVTPEEHILHGFTTLTNYLANAPTAYSDAQLQNITALCDASASW